MRLNRKATLACLALAVAGLVLLAQQLEEHPLIKRYPGSEVMGNSSVREFDEFELILGPIKSDAQGNRRPAKSQHLEGKITSITYRNPENRSVLEVYRNYELALKSAGFQILFACNGPECGEGMECCPHPMLYSPEYLRRFLAAKLTRSEGDVYVSLAVQAQGAQYTGNTQLDVIEVKPMETGMVTIDAAALAGDITRSGHVAVYGIYFDTGKADLKPESDPTLAEITKLLKQNPTLKLHVVGHTDSQGDLAMNMDLSRRRAAAVVQALTAKHGIAAARLRPDGVGPLAPVASNDTEEGRAKNRRVELVKQ